MDPLIHSWRRRNFGFAMDTHYLDHLVWCDNLYLLANSQSHWETMFSELLERFMKHGLLLKPGASEVIFSTGLGPFEEHKTFEFGEESSPHSVRLVEELQALGTSIDRTGSTNIAFLHRIKKAEVCFHLNANTLRNTSSAPVKRLRAFLASAGASLLFGCTSWIISKTLLEDIQTWERHHGRRIYDVARKLPRNRTANIKGEQHFF